MASEAFAWSEGLARPLLASIYIFQGNYFVNQVPVE